MTSEIQRVGVVGAGQMGAGIAQVAMQAGFQVRLADVHQEGLDRGVARIEKQLARAVDKGRMSAADKAGMWERLAGTTDLKTLGDMDVVIEAVPENEGLKREVFQVLDACVREDTLLASNTSSISITRLAATTRRPESFVGMHFMNPVPVMKLVELIPGLQTAEVTLQTIRTLAEKMGKTCIVSDDQPGFIVNRILMPMINEACMALGEGLGTAEDIDAGMKLGTNQPMGPLTLADFIGLDTCLSIMEVLHRGLGDDKYRPAPLLRRYVDAGWLGRKSGRGFYRYAE